MVDLDEELDDDLEIEFEDDTPDEDKGKDRAPEDASDDDDDLPDDEELRLYSKDGQKRIRQLTKKFHDERRAKEAIARERDEAATFARVKLSEAETLRKQLTTVANGAVAVHKDKYTAELADLKAKLAQAVDEGNGKEVAELTEKISEARDNIRQTKEAEETIKRNAEAQPTHTADPADPKNWPETRRKWAEQNKSWFGIDEEMTAVAYATHGKLAKAGVVLDSPEYYNKLTNRIKELFPDKFEDTDSGEEIEVPAPRKAAPKAAGGGGLIKTVVKGGKKIYQLTESQRAMCRRMGITPQQYIAEVNRMGKDDE